MTEETERFIPTDSKFEPGPGRVFVFGSNLAGIHGAGAAKTAYEKYGAVWGKGEGFTARREPDNTIVSSYAIPTKNGMLNTLPLNEVKHHIDRFIQFAKDNKVLAFFVTRIGCGLAGYTDYDIAPLFKDAPNNCELPRGWKRFEEMYGLFMPTRL